MQPYKASATGLATMIMAKDSDGRKFNRIPEYDRVQNGKTIHVSTHVRSKTVNDELKNVCYIEHIRHCSIDGFASNLIAGLIAYNLLPKKPSLNILTSLIKAGLLYKIIIPNSRLFKYAI